jgi:hypothetical protein
MRSLKHQAAALAVYAAVPTVLVGGIGVSLAAILNTAVVSEPTAKIKSPLDARIESAREVREALAKPIPAPEPLLPITAKVSRPSPKLATRPAPKQNREVAMQQARQLFARVDEAPSPPPFFGFMAFGR